MLTVSRGVSENLVSRIRCGPISFGFPLSLLALLLFSAVMPVSAQTLSADREVLLKRKAELLKSIEGYRRKQTESQATLDQATSLQRQAHAAGDATNASIASQAMDVAKQALANAQKYEREDRERLDAINRALTWPESNKPQGVATLVRGQIFRETPSGRVPFDPATPVRLGDRISTEDGFLELQLEDGSQMQIGPKTDFLYDRDVQGIYYQLFQGALHKITIIMGVRGANDQPRYKGLHCIAAVRGTEFTLELKNGQDVFQVFEGQIEVDPGGSRDKISLTGGQMLVVRKSGAVDQPVAFDARTAAHWWER